MTNAARFGVMWVVRWALWGYYGMCSSGGTQRRMRNGGEVRELLTVYINVDIPTWVIRYTQSRV